MSDNPLKDEDDSEERFHKAVEDTQERLDFAMAHLWQAFTGLSRAFESDPVPTRRKNTLEALHLTALAVDQVRERQP